MPIIPYVVIYSLVFIFGACIGSFYNVIAMRIPIKESFSEGRSHCPKCKHELSAKDLVPFFSYIFLKGKCRYCKEAISARYPLIELFGGLSAMFCVYQLGFTLEALLAFYVISVMTPLSLIDFAIQEIPDGFHIAMIPAIILSFILFPEVTLTSRIIGFFIISVPMVIIGELAGGFGGGDVRMMAVAGAMLGWKAILCAFLVGIFVALFYCIYIMATKKGDMQTAIAFGPYLAIGIVVAYFYSEPLITWYLNMFFYRAY